MDHAALRRVRWNRVAALVLVYITTYIVYMRKHKHLKIDQEKLTRVRRLLSAKTEQDTIEQALDMLVADEAIVRTYKKLRGKLAIDKVFD